MGKEGQSWRRECRGLFHKLYDNSEETKKDRVCSYRRGFDLVWDGRMVLYSNGGGPFRK